VCGQVGVVLKQGMFVFPLLWLLGAGCSAAVALGACITTHPCVSMSQARPLTACCASQQVADNLHVCTDRSACAGAPGSAAQSPATPPDRILRMALPARSGVMLYVSTPHGHVPE
jgi:hypothetical protein